MRSPINQAPERALEKETLWRPAPLKAECSVASIWSPLGLEGRACCPSSGARDPSADDQCSPLYSARFQGLGTQPPEHILHLGEKPSEAAEAIVGGGPIWEGSYLGGALSAKGLRASRDRALASLARSLPARWMTHSCCS